MLDDKINPATKFEYRLGSGERVFGTAEYSEEDGVWYGVIVGIDDLVTYEADSRGDLFESFCDAVEDWRETKQAVEDGNQ